MRAYVVNNWHHPSQLKLANDVPEPKVAQDEILVDVVLILQVQGKYQVKPPFPFTLGAEFAGRVAIGSPIPKGCPYNPGDRIFGSTQGCFADKLAVKWQTVIPLPDNLTYDQGAGLFITWPTSYEALVGRAELKPGESVLVHAAAGGVGIIAIQLAKALGATVIAAAGSQSKRDICKMYADHTVDYTANNWQQEVLKITGGKGVDVVFDPVGRIAESLKCIAFKGRAIVIGFAAGHIENLPLNQVLLKNISVMGLHWGLYTRKEPSRIPVVWKELLDTPILGYSHLARAKPVIYDKVFPLEELVIGLDALDKRQTWGKVIVRIKDEEQRVVAKL